MNKNLHILCFINKLINQNQNKLSIENKNKNNQTILLTVIQILN